MQRAAEALKEPLISAYGPCGGMPALVAVLKQKLADENGLTGVRARVIISARCAHGGRQPAGTAFTVKPACITSWHTMCFHGVTGPTQAN